MKKFKCEFCDVVFTQEAEVIPPCPKCKSNFDIIPDYDCGECGNPLSTEDSVGFFCSHPQCKQYNKTILSYK
jgi:Zn finger protein HypA/HybF involved in hydrogenase expression